jgi:predicted ester cyclase
VSNAANKALIRRLVNEGQEKGNVDVVDELLAPDFVDHTPFPDVPPTRDGVKMLFQYLRGAFPDLTVRIDEQVAEDDKVVTRKTFLGTHLGEFMGIPSTGKPVTVEVIDIMDIHEGRAWSIVWCSTGWAFSSSLHRIEVVRWRVAGWPAGVSPARLPGSAPLARAIRSAIGTLPRPRRDAAQPAGETPALHSASLPRIPLTTTRS